MVNSEQLKKLHIGVEWVDALNETFNTFGISTQRQQAAFIGQCGHECGNFRILEENLNYRAETLMKLWKARFPTMEIANQYAKNPKKIANKVYSSRMGNRDEASGDGYKFRGRGYIQLTGKDNYTAFGKSIGVDMSVNPDSVASTHALTSAAWFWSKNKLNEIADTGATDEVVTKITKRVNGGTIGLADRIKHFKEFHTLLV